MTSQRRQVGDVALFGGDLDVFCRKYGRELRQQHPSDLMSGGDVPRAGTSRRRTTNHSGVVAVTPSRP